MICLVIDTSVWLGKNNPDKLQSVHKNGCRVYIPNAVYEEVKKISEGYLKSIFSDCFKALLKQLEDGFVLISTNGTGIVNELQKKLEKEEIKPLKAGDEYEPPDVNDLRILAAAIYLKQTEREGAIYLLTHDRWLAQFAVRCGIQVLGVKVCNGWAKKQPIPWRRLSEF